MTENKELIRKDLAMILKLDAQLDYSQKAVVEKCYKQIVQKNLLTTSLGKKYRTKLEQIIGGTAYNQCLFCAGGTQGSTVICPACMAKLKQPFSAKENVQNAAGQAADKAKENIQTIAGQAAKQIKENAQTIAGQAARKTKESAQTIAGQVEKQTGAKLPKQGKNRNKKGIILSIAVLITAASIVSAIGLDTIFAFFALVSLGVLVYKALKREPRRNPAIAFAVFLLLAGITGASASKVSGDNVLDYIGAKENAVYKTYDKDGFVEDTAMGVLSNASTNKSGLPHIEIDSSTRRIYSVTLESGMNASLNVNGLHIGDDVNQVEKCMKKLRASKDSASSVQELHGSLYGSLIYNLRYHRKKMAVSVHIAGGIVSGIFVIVK